MAITADVDIGNGVTAAGCYIIIPYVYVKKFTNEDGSNPIFKLIYDAEIYQNAGARVGRQNGKLIRCRHVDHHKTDYDPTTTDNPFKLAYTHLKTNGKLSSVSDA